MTERQIFRIIADTRPDAITLQVRRSVRTVMGLYHAPLNLVPYSVLLISFRQSKLVSNYCHFHSIPLTIQYLP